MKLAHDPLDSTHWYIEAGDYTVNKEANRSLYGSGRYDSKGGPPYLIIYRRAVLKAMLW